MQPVGSGTDTRSENLGMGEEINREGQEQTFGSLSSGGEGLRLAVAAVLT